MAPKAVGYIRQSRDQESQPNTEAAQFDAIMRYHEGAKIQTDSWPREIVFERDIEVSGMEVPFFERRGGAAIKKIVQRGDKIICSKADRLSRRLRDIQDVADWCFKNGVSLYLLDLPGLCVDPDSAAGVMTLQILGVFAEFECRRIRERIKAGLAARKRQGKRISRGPGYRNKFVPMWDADGKPVLNGQGHQDMLVVEDEELCVAINMIMQMTEQGYQSPAIVAYLNLHHTCPEKFNHGSGVWNKENVAYLVWHERRTQRGVEHSNSQKGRYWG